MIPPTDLVALRALVEATLNLQTAASDLVNPRMAKSREGARLVVCISAVGTVLPAAQEAMERIDEILLKDRGKTREINILTRENREQAARIARLEGALTKLLACTHGDEATCGCRVTARAALEGRDE